MGVPRQRNCAFLREPGLQGAEANAQVVARRHDRSARLVGQRLRHTRKLRQLPDRPSFRSRCDPAQIGLGSGRPIQQMKRRLGQIHYRRADRMRGRMVWMRATREPLRHRPPLNLMPA